YRSGRNGPRGGVGLQAWHGGCLGRKDAVVSILALLYLGRNVMRETQVTLPELALIAGTRVALGAGLRLIVADRPSDDQRKAIGWTLFLIGAITTVPLAFEVLGGRRFSAREAWPELAANEYRPESSDRLGDRSVSVPS